MNETPDTRQYTASTADQIDRDMHQPEADKHPRHSATFTPTPYGQIHVYVVDRGYPREGIIAPTQLVRHVTRAMELGFTIIDRTQSNERGDPSFRS